ncbi:uncharacterized protein NPIL_119531 [Nephila pilipes]|uniref:Uncharacterized protein n=1 Tax=Nephila pilipes TaxID=299642 RepID=A0A8X6TQ65_NEPPI|nr:uncharacterized protein NPIL_119531 [Nephila pilipes]
MYFLQIFVLMCGLKTIFDQRILENWSKTGKIAPRASDLRYIKYFAMCYSTEFRTLISFDFWLVDQSKPFKEKCVSERHFIQCILQFLYLFQCKIRTNQVLHYLKKLFWIIGVTFFA